MLAEAPVGKSRAGAFSREFPAHPLQLGPVNLGANHSREDASAIGRDDLNLSVFMVLDAACKYLVPANSRSIATSKRGGSPFALFLRPGCFAIIVTSLDAHTSAQRQRKIDGRGAGVEKVERPDINGAAG